MSQRTRFERLNHLLDAREKTPKVDPNTVFKVYLVSGRIYEFEGKRYEFAYLSSTGKAVIHPPGEPDMQSCLAVDRTELRGPL